MKKIKKALSIKFEIYKTIHHVLVNMDNGQYNIGMLDRRLSNTIQREQFHDSCIL